jgi:propane monooxygenase large subunit
MVVEKVDDQWRTYCSETCYWTDAVAFRGEYDGRPTPNMGRLTGFREWETLHHNKDLADIVQDLGYVRDDGKTLIGQPHLDLDDPKKMWTLDDVRGNGCAEGVAAQPSRLRQCRQRCASRSASSAAGTRR